MRPILDVRRTCRFLLIGVFIHTLSAPAALLYVDVNNPNPRSPYNSWGKAARTIQEAVDVASAGDQILVTNGVYQIGGRVFSGGALTNRVMVDKPLSIQSVSGPAATVILGYQVPSTTNGPSAVRCVYLASGAALVGFTLANGATIISGDLAVDGSGAGVNCASASAVVSNCIITGNAGWSGGGGCGGSFNYCTFIGNSALDSGGGALDAFLSHCFLSGNFAGTNGGGSHRGTLSDSVLIGNYAGTSGGGVDLGSLTGCTMTNNRALYGGAANNSTLSNCSLSNNSALYGGGVYGGRLTNCILTANSATDGGAAFSGLLYSCLLAGNSASNTGGGMWIGTMNNCTVVSNSASGEGGGAYYCDLTNC